MDSDRHRRRLVLTAILDEDQPSQALVKEIAEAETPQKTDNERLEEMCATFDRLHAEARQKVWDLIKIPIAPGSVIFAAVEAAVMAANLPRNVGYSILVADIAWMVTEVVRGLFARSRAVAERDGEVVKIQSFMHGRDERTSMVFRDIVHGHDFELQNALRDG